ncbi:chorismate synthase [Lactobacillus delbrueckii subsp. lactis]|uniref:chorismate synthase n=1 Tax=Lactobacillus delbrueckii TaxID=1584 RepID=UPI001E2F42C6|nr:chorismate synthase [Lactobacillus delbrueckii]MCD5598703.1 chorismate synthase [Lactobacillus delbrueckii subsp. lactis]
MALGNIAQQFLRQLDIDLVAYVAQVGPVEADSEKPLDVSEIRQKIFQNDMHVIDQDKVEDLHQLISETKEKGDTLGGIIRLVATGLPAGLGKLRQLGHGIGRQACRGRCRGQCRGQFRHDESSFAGNFGRQLLCQSIDRGCFFK